jgi:hypothetical protein
LGATSLVRVDAAGVEMAAAVTDRRGVTAAAAGSSSSSSSDSSDDVSSSLLLSVSSFFGVCECRNLLWNGFFSGVAGGVVVSGATAVVDGRLRTVGVGSVGVGGVLGVSIDVRGVTFGFSS